MAFLDILPDPNNRIADTGANNWQAPEWSPGPGFANMTLTSNDKVMMNKTNTGRVITRKLATQQWKVKISYNPLTRDEFEPVYNFLLYYGKLRPFYVELPQHKLSSNTGGSFDTSVVTSATNAGAQYIVAKNFSADSKADKPRPGDMFTVADSSDSLHEKMYRVLRVETPSVGQYEGTAPSSGTARIWTYPNILRSISDSSPLTFQNPKMRVIMDKDVVSYSLNTDNLYKFDLQLTEALA